MILLGIETSCDETAASIVQINSVTKKISVVSNVIASSLSLHAKTGGIIPEVAAREQIRSIHPVLHEALLPLSTDNNKALDMIDAIAITYGPGLIGSLLVGVETARTLSFISSKPLIPVNHMYGHIYANWIDDPATTANHQPQVRSDAIVFPALALVVSGGHTDLLLLKSHLEWSVIGGTRDDAAGEAFDKIGRLLHLSYPAGPIISQLAKKGDPKAFRFPRPMWDSKDYDFSFSGLKTSVLTLLKKNQWETSLPEDTLFDIAASVEQAIVDVLLHKLLAAAKEFSVKSILLGGGVSANEKLRLTIQQKVGFDLPGTRVWTPSKEYCTDNAAMIAVAGYFQSKQLHWKDLTADPQLYY